MKLAHLPAIVYHFLYARHRWHHLRGDALTAYQEKRAERLIKFVHTHSPFYREHWTGHDLRNWRAFPTVDKRLMMEHFSAFNTRGILREEAMETALRAERSRDFQPSLKDGITIGLSSGTSGHRGLFLAGKQEQAAWAGTILSRTLHRLPTRRLRIAFFLRSNSNLYEEIGGSVIQFRYFDLMQPLNEAVVALNSFQPDFLIGPPSLLGFLAQEQRHGRLHISPQRLVSVAEVLEPHDREQIEGSFNAPVHQIYQCTEGLLAISCRQGSLHIQEDLVVLQLEPLPNGEKNRVTPIVTDLWRTTQPIIRYRLNDILRLAPSPCPCGSPYQVIEAIEGRCDDICYFESLSGESRAFYPDTIRRMILLASPDIEDYQVIQERPAHLKVQLEIKPGISLEDMILAVKTSIQATLAQYECRPAEVEIEQRVEALTPGSKRRRVQRS